MLDKQISSSALRAGEQCSRSRTHNPRGLWQNLLNNMAHMHLSLSQRPLTAMHVHHKT
jgi:hypothetical protein